MKKGFSVSTTTYSIVFLKNDNSCDFCLNDPGEDYPGWRLLRGGAWNNAGVRIRSAARTGSATSRVLCHSGGRLSCVPRLRTPK